MSTAVLGTPVGSTLMPEVMPDPESHFEQQGSRAGRSPYERLRLQEADRGAIIADGVTVLLFALATFRGIAQYGSGI